MPVLRCWSGRFGPPGTAWDRLGPDKIFSPREKGEEIDRETGGACKWERIEDEDEDEDDEEAGIGGWKWEYAVA
jgi:hypothetical protein